MAESQFPPSSPILSHRHDDDNDDIENNWLPRKKVVLDHHHDDDTATSMMTPLKDSTNKKLNVSLPTPNASSDFPSSSIGFQPVTPVRKKKYNSTTTRTKESTIRDEHSTSPLDHNVASDQDRIVSIPEKSSDVNGSGSAAATATANNNNENHDSKYRFISPMDNVKIVQLPSNKNEELVIGRSSKQSDVVLDNKKKNISKRHVSITVDHLTNMILFKCLGINGFNLTIPKSCLVKSYENEKDEYMLEPTSRCNYNYDNLTNIMVLKGEIVRVPKMKGILLDIWDEFVLCDIEAEQQQKQQHQEVGELTELDEKNKPEVIIGKEEEEKETTTVATTTITEQSSIPAPTQPQVEDNKKDFKKPEKRSRSKSPEIDSQEEKKLKLSSSSEVLPPPDELFKDISDEEVIAKLSTIDSNQLKEIENLLINHLAFSRLSSTPLSSLQKISQKTNQLSRQILQLILIKKIECIGVIYRIGKDAAGKPLEEEYYYQLDKDLDFERQKLVQDLKGANSSLRSCRKQHKQYFWKKPKSKTNK